MFMCFHVIAIAIYYVVFSFFTFKAVKDVKSGKSNEEMPTWGMVIVLYVIGLIPIINIVVLGLFIYETFLKEWLSKPIAEYKEKKSDEK